MLKIEERFFPVIYFLIFTFLYYGFYPVFYSFEDEASYFGMGYVISKGSLYPDETNTQIIHTYLNGAHYVTKHPLGISLLIAPLFYINYKMVFVIPFLLFLLGYVYYSRWLKRKSIPLYLSFLYLFFPPFVLYSRTLMSDLPGAVFVLISFYYFSKGKNARDAILCGFYGGLSVLFKHPNILFIFAISILITYEFIIEKKERESILKKSLMILTGTIPSALLIGVLNYYLYNGVFNLPENVGYFSINHLLPHLGRYLVSLNLVYPLMFLCIFFVSKYEQVPIILTLIIYLLFYSLYYFLQGVGNFYKDIVLSQRFMLPVSALLLLPYTDFINKILSSFVKKKKIVPVLIGALLLITLSFFINLKHQRFLESQRFFRDMIYTETDDQTLILIDETTVELLQDIWGKRKFRVFDYHGGPAINFNDIGPFNSNKIAIVFRKRMSNSMYIEGIVKKITDFFEYRCYSRKDKEYSHNDQSSVLFIISFDNCLN